MILLHDEEARRDEERRVRIIHFHRKKWPIFYHAMVTHAHSVKVTSSATNALSPCWLFAIMVANNILSCVGPDSNHFSPSPKMKE